MELFLGFSDFFFFNGRFFFFEKNFRTRENWRADIFEYVKASQSSEIAKSRNNRRGKESQEKAPKWANAGHDPSSECM